MPSRCHSTLTSASSALKVIVDGSPPGMDCPGSRRVRVKIMESQKRRNVGKSQSVLAMINPVIVTRTRTQAHKSGCTAAAPTTQLLARGKRPPNPP
jgi:hypothetical protein